MWCSQHATILICCETSHNHGVELIARAKCIQTEMGFGVGFGSFVSFIVVRHEGTGRAERMQTIEFHWLASVIEGRRSRKLSAARKAAHLIGVMGILNVCDECTSEWECLVCQIVRAQVSSSVVWHPAQMKCSCAQPSSRCVHEAIRSKKRKSNHDHGLCARMSSRPPNQGA